jgi:beta-lactamase superfamily II metal-dependent hydrolase
MTSSKLVILDVGHGSSAVLTNDSITSVFDAGLGGILIDFLQHHGISAIDHFFISHADADHIAGLVGLLSLGTIVVRKVYLNPDPIRTSKIWGDLISVLKEAKPRGTVVINGLSTTIPGKVAVADCEIHILAPEPDLALTGVGGTTVAGQKLTAHTLNAVIRVLCGQESVALFPGDLDEVGLKELEQSQKSLPAKVLIFPHHGGIPGKDAAAFTAALCKLVMPKVVIFSIGRGKHKTPRPEVVGAIKQTVPGVYIACTQLSERCAATAPKNPPTHLNSEAASGRERNHCCAGTIVIEPASFSPKQDQHTEFVKMVALTALCQKYN